MDDVELVEALCDIEEGLTEWELGFVEDMASRKNLPRSADEKSFMTAGQRNKCLQIWEEKGDA